jgi:hypothetical protein
LSITAAESQFGSTPPQWSPSESSKLQFPIFPSENHRVDGDLLFAYGREDFSQLDQLGSFTSHTYGGGLGFEIAKGQSLKGFALYQTRTHHQSYLGFGAQYGIHF